MNSEENIAGLVAQLTAGDCSVQQVLEVLSGLGYDTLDSANKKDAPSRDPSVHLAVQSDRAASHDEKIGVESPEETRNHVMIDIRNETTRRGFHPWDIELQRQYDKRALSTIRRAPSYTFPASSRAPAWIAPRDQPTPATASAPRATTGTPPSIQFGLVEPRVRGPVFAPPPHEALDRKRPRPRGGSSGSRPDVPPSSRSRSSCKSPEAPRPATAATAGAANVTGGTTAKGTAFGRAPRWSAGERGRGPKRAKSADGHDGQQRLPLRRIPGHNSEMRAASRRRGRQAEEPRVDAWKFVKPTTDGPSILPEHTSRRRVPPEDSKPTATNPAPGSEQRNSSGEQDSRPQGEDAPVPPLGPRAPVPRSLASSDGPTWSDASETGQTTSGRGLSLAGGHEVTRDLQDCPAATASGGVRGSRSEGVEMGLGGRRRLESQEEEASRRDRRLGRGEREAGEDTRLGRGEGEAGEDTRLGRGEEREGGWSERQRNASKRAEERERTHEESRDGVILVGPSIGPKGGPKEARRMRLEALAAKELKERQEPAARRGPGQFTAPDEIYATAAAAPPLALVKRPRSAVLSTTPRFEDDAKDQAPKSRASSAPRAQRGEPGAPDQGRRSSRDGRALSEGRRRTDPNEEASGREMDPWAAKDSLRPRAPSFAFGKAGRAPQTPETDRAASVTTAPLSEARTARYDFTEPRRDLGVMQWRAEDGDAEAARRRRERFRRIAEARREAMAALRTAFVGCGANGGPGGLAAGLDAAIVPRRPAWGFGLPPSAQPPGRVPDVADAEGDTGAPILAPVPDLDVVRPRLGGAPDFGRATGRQAADTRRRRDRHQLGLLMYSLDGAFRFLGKRAPAPHLNARLDRFRTGLYRALQVDNRGATLEERPEEALDRIRRRVRAADFGARVQTRPKKAAVTDRDLGISLDLETARDAVLRRRSLGALPFAGAGHHGAFDEDALRVLQEGSARPGPSTYRPMFGQIEPDTHGGAIPASGRGLEEIPRMLREGDILDIELDTAEGITRRRRGAFYDMARTLARPDPGYDNEAPSFYEYLSADAGDVLRWQAPRALDMGAAAGRQEARISEAEALRGPGTYGAYRESHPRGPDIGAGAERAPVFPGRLAYDDVQDLDVPAATDRLRPRAPAAIITEEHAEPRDHRVAETWDLEYDVGYDLVDPRARVPDMERMRGRDPLHRPAVTRPSEMVEDLPLSVLATRGAVDFEKGTGRQCMGDLQRQVDRRGGNVLDLDVEGAEAAIKKRVNVPDFDKATNRSLGLGIDALTDDLAQWRPLQYDAAGVGTSLTRARIGGSLVQFDRQTDRPRVSGTAEDWRSYEVAAATAAVRGKAPEADFTAPVGRDVAAVGAPATRDSWEGQRVALRMKDAWGEPSKKERRDQPMAKVMGRQEGPEDTDGQALALRHPDTIQEALSTRRRAPRAIFPRAREAARATTVWEEQQRTVKAAVKDAPVQEGAVRDRVRRMVAAAKEKMRRDAGSGERGQEKDGGDVSGLRLEEQSRGQAKRVGVFTRKFGLGYMHAANRDVIRSLIE